MDEPSPRACDLIIRNAFVLTLDSQRSTYPAGAVAITGHTIEAAGPETEVLSCWQSSRVIDAKGGLVHPGIIDAHLHVNAQTCRGYFRGDASRGGADGPRYADWKAALAPEDEHAAAMLAGVEMLRHGITAYVEPGSAFEPDAVASAATAVGIRCSLADPYLWDDTESMEAIPGLLSPSLAARVPPQRERCLKLLGGQLFRNRESAGILHGHIALYGEGTASDELFGAAKALADREGVVLNSHIGFDIELAEAMERRWGAPRFVHLAERGLLGTNTTFVHMNLIRDEEVDPILSSGLTMVWCPLAYMTRGTPLRRPTRLPEMKRRGAQVALGTDSARQSSAGDAGFLALLLSAEAGQTLGAEEVLEMQTLGGAQAAGLEKIVGSLEPGKRADIVMRSPELPEMGPGIDPAHQLVAVGHGPTADTVLVNGAVVLRHGRSTRVDEGMVIAAARASAQQVAARLGLRSPGAWSETTSHAANS